MIICRRKSRQFKYVDGPKKTLLKLYKIPVPNAARISQIHANLVDPLQIYTFNPQALVNLYSSLMLSIFIHISTFCLLSTFNLQLSLF